ncbi:hypothetical protein CHS0354_020738 [Potamilus streckersoni]|uniref:C-type lectin domain-containing protein n=1 Tax=Potamilus streckersoni TaxID=2493646 RepID=A0AAE0SCN2_9BIVA|nr:hypothetical protein CHS0354_020738 [Potamilus streckersoni]
MLWHLFLEVLLLSVALAEKKYHWKSSYGAYVLKISRETIMRLHRFMMSIKDLLGLDQCPEHYTKYVLGDSPFCYRFYPNLCTDWQKVRDFCQYEGADLISLTEDNFEFFRELASDLTNNGCGNGSLWVGLTDKEIEGNWRFLNGEPLSLRSSIWSSNANLHDPNNDCAAMSAPDFYLVASNCTISYSAICQIYLNP